VAACRARAGTAVKRLVLAGAGHAHALLLLAMQRAPLRDTEVLVISPQPLAPYSGMVPGWLAGAYRFEEIAIDFLRLAATVGARWQAGEIDAVDADHQRLRLADGSELGYDLLSLNIGSTLRPPAVPGARVLALRPLAALRDDFERLLALWAGDTTDAPAVVTAVGGGAAGFEALLAVLARLRALRPDRVLSGRLLTRGDLLLPGLPHRARRAAERALGAAGVQWLTGTSWSDRMVGVGDVVLWAAGAEAHDWQRDSGRRGSLAVDDAGFVRVDPTLRSLSHRQVFASGDCAAWPGRGLPKAGVFAVRMAPVLAHNLRHALGEAAAPVRYQPQDHYLVLLATANRRAIAARGPWAAEGAWAWRWKDHIDRRFIARFGDGGGSGVS
jgi:pyridine nucleotide-disulfide oxidoreductase family protein